MPTALTKDQLKIFRQLSGEFDEALKARDLDRARKVVAKVTPLLRTSSNEAKLHKFKVAYFELVLDLGDLKKAAGGAAGILARTSSNTRIHLEAAVLVAVCYFRNGEIEEAEKMIAYVMANESAITSLPRRIEFKKNVSDRVEAECLIAHMRGLGLENVSGDRVAEKAIQLAKKPIGRLIYELGEAAPGEAVLFTRTLRQSSRKALPYNERKLLADKDEPLESDQVGDKLLGAFRRQLFDSLCNPKSDTYKNFYDRPLKGIAWSTPLAAHIVEYLKQQKMCWWALAVPLVALFIKMGIGTFCEYHRPKGVMVDRR